MRSYKKRKYGKKPYRKRKGIPKRQWKASKKAAKQVFNRMVETKKQHIIGNVQGIASGNFYDLVGYNPFTRLSTGDEQDQIVGNEFWVRYFELRFFLTHTAAAQGMIPELHLRFTLLKTARILPLQAGTPYVTAANIPAEFWAYGTIGTPSEGGEFLRKFNSNVVKVLYQKRYTLGGKTGNTNVATVGRFGKVKFRGIKGRKTYSQAFGQALDSLGNLKNGNYYVLIEMYSPYVATESNDYSLRYDTSLYYKDP